MSKSERVMADMAPSLSRGGDLKTRQHSLATNGSSQRIAIPTEWRGRAVSFTAQGQDCFLSFGDSNVAASGTNVSTVATEVLTAVNDVSEYLPAGVTKRWRIPVSTALCTHFAFIGAAGGFLRFGPTTGDGT